MSRTTASHTKADQFKIDFIGRVQLFIIIDGRARDAILVCYHLSQFDLLGS